LLILPLDATEAVATHENPTLADYGDNAMSRELSHFIGHARERGLDHGTIRMLLVSSGWREKDVIEALANTSLELPIPAPPDRGGAREAFFHLLTFAAFYASVTALIFLLFQYINLWFPALATATAPNISSSIRWSMAFVIIAFPSFLWLSRTVLDQIRSDPDRAWSPVRRWLTYLSLLIASITLAGDLITLVFGLLDGELSLRLLLKVLVLLLIAGLTIAYFLLSLRLPVGKPQTTQTHRCFAATATALAFGTVLCGFFLAGSPNTGRLQRLDERRLTELQSIYTEIKNISLGASQYLPPDQRSLQNPVPRTLQDLATRAVHRRPEIRDPASGHEYGYRLLDETHIQLCARFDTERTETMNPQWNHRTGRHCFEFDVLRQ